MFNASVVLMFEVNIIVNELELCSLLVEEIDVGEAKLRQVVSGLAKYFSPDELTVM